MFWKKKESRGLPDLPEIKENRPSIDIYNRPPMEAIRIPRFPQKPQENSFLPEIPKKSFEETKSFSVSEEHVEDHAEELPSLPGSHSPEIISQSGRKPRIIEIDSNEMPEKDYQVAEPEYRVAPSESLPKRRIQEKLFVRLDKFKNARDALDAVKEKLKEMDNLLKEIREVKNREDRELSSWESEVEIVRSTISSIGKEIFEGAEE